jgi:hypothetical protein
MKYSLRSLMIVITLVCVVFGVPLGYVRYERDRLQHKSDVASLLRFKGVTVEAHLPGSEGLSPAERRQRWEQMRSTWRGNELLDCVEGCVISGAPVYKGRMNADDFAILVSTFPNIVDLALADSELCSEHLRQLAALPRLRKLEIWRTPVDDDDIRWIKAHHPKIEITITKE